MVEVGFMLIKLNIIEKEGVMTFEVKVEKDWRGYNVRLILWEGESGMSTPKVSGVSKKEASKTATELANLYNCEIIGERQ